MNLRFCLLGCLAGCQASVAPAPVPEERAVMAATLAFWASCISEGYPALVDQSSFEASFVRIDLPPLDAPSCAGQSRTDLVVAATATDLQPAGTSLSLPEYATLWAAFRRVNRRPLALTAPLGIDGIRVHLRQRSTESRGEPLVQLSRVGFSAAADTALIEIFEGKAGNGLLLERRVTGWRVTAVLWSTFE